MGPFWCCLQFRAESKAWGEFEIGVTKPARRSSVSLEFGSPGFWSGPSRRDRLRGDFSLAGCSTVERVVWDEVAGFAIN